MTNIIRHAYKSRYDQAIQLNCQISAEYLEFRLLDQGEPPDLSKIGSEPLNEHSLSGRGTHMMKLMMDEVCYERVPGGNLLRLRKHLAGADISANSE